jgi:hypothetical protein
MWWKCDVQFFRTSLRLTVWARSESEARAKVGQMYLVATIRNLVPSDRSDSIPCTVAPSESAVERFRRFEA